MTKSVREIIDDYLATGNYSVTFENIYALAKASDGHPPWAYMQAIPDLVQWVEKTNFSGDGKRAIVVGCGMGDDAEFLAKIGFDVTAFDVSETAIMICHERFPNSSVTYQQADLFKLPNHWHNAFDFVLENRTIQALPASIAEKSMTAIAKLIAANGQLLLLCNGRDPDAAKNSIPWAISRTELNIFRQLGLNETYFDDIHVGSVRRFVVLYQR